MDMRKFWGENITIILIVVMLSWVYEYVKIYYFIHFKYVYYYHKLFLNKAVKITFKKTLRN